MLCKEISVFASTCTPIHVVYDLESNDCFVFLNDLYHVIGKSFQSKSIVNFKEWLKEVKSITKKKYIKTYRPLPSILDDINDDETKITSRLRSHAYCIYSWKQIMKKKRTLFSNFLFPTPFKIKTKEYRMIASILKQIDRSCRKERRLWLREKGQG